jgi:hypothetical protein
MTLMCDAVQRADRASTLAEEFLFSTKTMTILTNRWQEHARFAFLMVLCCAESAISIPTAQYNLQCSCVATLHLRSPPKIENCAKSLKVRVLEKAHKIGK